MDHTFLTNISIVKVNALFSFGQKNALKLKSLLSQHWTASYINIQIIKIPYQELGNSSFHSMLATHMWGT